MEFVNIDLKSTARGQLTKPLAIPNGCLVPNQRAVLRSLADGRRHTIYIYYAGTYTEMKCWVEYDINGFILK